MLPYTICKVLFDGLMMKWDRNPLNDGVRNLTGEKVLSLGKKFDFQHLKTATRSLKITINDFMMTALSMAVKRHFTAKGDDTTAQINVAIPVSIRWEPYTTFDSVKLENKFAPMIL